MARKAKLRTAFEHETIYLNFYQATQSLDMELLGLLDY